MDINQISSSTNYEEIKEELSKEENATGTGYKKDIEKTLMQHMLNMGNDISEYKNRITNLEEQKKPERKYFKAAKLNIQVSNLVFLILPFLQLFITVYAVSRFSLIESGYIETYKYILNAVGIGVVIELFYVPFQIHKINDRLDDLEN
jgi:hypothetical protein